MVFVDEIGNANLDARSNTTRLGSLFQGYFPYLSCREDLSSTRSAITTIRMSRLTRALFCLEKPEWI
jgi:hypothetical protein